MKFVGKVGFWEPSVETKPGIYKPVITERIYRGDVLKDYRRFQSEADKQNEDLIIRNRISIIFDLYMNEHLSSIRYVEWSGVKWKVTSLETIPPRIILDLGGVYNE